MSALLFARPHPTPGPLMRDFEAYYAAGEASLHGDDPYSAAIWKYEKGIDGVNPSRPEVLPFVGPPPALLLWRSVARLPYDVAVRLWQAILLLCAGLVAFLCARFARIRAGAAAVFAIAVIALGFGPLTSDLALGQIALFSFAVVLAAAVLAPYRPVAAALCVCAGFVQPNVGLVSSGIVRDRRTLFVVLLGALLFAEIAMLGGGIDRLMQYAMVLAAHGQAERFAAIQITPQAILYGFGTPPLLASLTGDAIAVAVTVYWIYAVRTIGGAAERLALTCAAAPLAMPFFHEHDLVLLLLPALLIAVRSRSPIAPAAFFLCSIDWLGLAQRPDGTVQTILLSSGALLALLTLRAFTRVELAYALGVIAIAAILGGVAAYHPLGVWPDAMHAFHIAPNASLATRWEAEQRASGLLEPNAFAAALRILPLLGCAVLSLSCKALALEGEVHSCEATARNFSGLRIT